MNIIMTTTMYEYILKQDLMLLVERCAKGGKIAAVETSIGAHAFNHRQA